MTDFELQRQLSGFISQYGPEISRNELAEQIALAKRRKALGALQSLLMDLSVEDLRRAERVALAAATPLPPSVSTTMHVEKPAPATVKSSRRSRR